MAVLDISSQLNRVITVINFFKISNNLHLVQEFVNMKRTSIMRKDRNVDLQRSIQRAQRFSPSPIRKGRSSKSNSKNHKMNSLSQMTQRETPLSFPHPMTVETDKENNMGQSGAGVAEDCRTIDATPEAALSSQMPMGTASPKLEVDNMGLYKLPILKNQNLNK